jgi:hypothetical protein
MKTKYFSICTFFLLIVSFINAQENNDSKKNNIFEVLTTPDSISKATVKIHQDKRIEALVVNKKYNQSLTANGFRVQIFSSNVQRTAKSDAFRIEKLIQEAYPEQAVYVNYTSPFWKVRVGDFKTKDEAQMFRNQLVESFPTMKSEIYIVPELINISESK